MIEFRKNSYQLNIRYALYNYFDIVVDYLKTYLIVTILPPVKFFRSLECRENTALGVPAAAHNFSNFSKSSSIKILSIFCM